MKRILINETEKNEILNQHKDFKKILEEKKINLDKGLMIEQRVQDPIFFGAYVKGSLPTKKDATTLSRVFLLLILVAVPCSCCNELIISCSCFPFGIYTLINSVPLPDFCDNSSNIFLIL